MIKNSIITASVTGGKKKYNENTEKEEKKSNFPEVTCVRSRQALQTGYKDLLLQDQYFKVPIFKTNIYNQSRPFYKFKFINCATTSYLH